MPGQKLQVLAGAKKNRGARLHRGGFPYNLMKSHIVGGQCLPLSFFSPPLPLIDNTKVQHTVPVEKNKKQRLLIKTTLAYCNVFSFQYLKCLFFNHLGIKYSFLFQNNSIILLKNIFKKFRFFEKLFQSIICQIDYFDFSGVFKRCYPGKRIKQYPFTKLKTLRFGMAIV
ncbi:MAG: hypothetical protein IPM98_16415 [Lewinellaceae bacterium]|nr:hypothetical protein [Lewinellaceae bacterium]